MAKIFIYVFYFNIMDISFTSNLVFVDRNKFENLSRNCPNYVDMGYVRHKKLKLNDTAYTKGVRDCSAGGIVNKDGVAIFHYLPYESNVLKAHDICGLRKELDEKIKKPVSGLLFGVKDYIDYFAPPDFSSDEYATSIYSKNLFYEIKNALRERMPISFFREHSNHDAQTHAIYTKDEDTWYLCVDSIKNSERGKYKTYVKSVKDLTNNFKEIYINPNDKLFVGEKEVTREDCPQLFVLV